MWKSEIKFLGKNGYLLKTNIMNLKEEIIRIREVMELDSEDEHIGIWMHGGTGKFLDGEFLYVTDDLKEALHYARIKKGNVYKLKDEYNYIVDWALGQSEGMISQEKLEQNGGFHNLFELFIDL